MSDTFQYQVSEEDEGRRLDTQPDLVSAAGSRSRLQRLIEGGSVQVNGVVKPSRTRLHCGDILDIEVPAEEPTELKPEDIDLDFIHQDADVVVVNKVPGMVVHPGPGHSGGTLVNALLHHIPELKGLGTDERPGLVHRLDRDTSGLMVVARNLESLRILQEGFSTRAVTRRYLAVCWGRRLEDRTCFETPYGRHPQQRKKFTSKVGARTAITHVEVLARGQAALILGVRLETGRTHQIRVHLSEGGHPLIADPIYGQSRNPRYAAPGAMDEVRILSRVSNLMLHAGALSFVHPKTGSKLSFCVPPPEAYRSAIVDWLGAPLWDEIWTAFTS